MQPTHAVVNSNSEEDSGHPSLAWRTSSVMTTAGTSSSRDCQCMINEGDQEKQGCHSWIQTYIHSSVCPCHVCVSAIKSQVVSHSCADVVSEPHFSQSRLPFLFWVNKWPKSPDWSPLRDSSLLLFVFPVKDLTQNNDLDKTHTAIDETTFSVLVALYRCPSMSSHSILRILPKTWQKVPSHHLLWLLYVDGLLLWETAGQCITTFQD